MSTPKTFHPEGLRREHESKGKAYMEFLREPAMSAGLYILPTSSEDPQSPHTEDEVYVVLNGRGSIQLPGEDRPVVKGSMAYVPAHTEHRFHSIEEPLEVLVLFSPAEGSHSGAAGAEA